MISPYVHTNVRAVGSERFRFPTDRRLTEEVVIRPTVRFRVGQSLVSIGTHLMGAERLPMRDPIRPAA